MTAGYNGAMTEPAQPASVYDLAHAEEACRDAVTLADRRGHPLTTAIAFWGMGYLHLFRSEPGR